MSFRINPFTSQFDEVGGSSITTWESPVANAGSLPVTDYDGAARVTKDTDKIYVFNLGSVTWTDTGITLASFKATPTAQGLDLTTNTAGNIVTRTLALSAADATNPGGVSTTTQSFSGNKTFTNNATIQGTTFANGGIDTTSAGGTLSIGTINSGTVNIGSPSATVNIQGSVTNIHSTNLNVTNALITINSGGSAGSGAGAGLQVEENAIDTGYIKVSPDRNSWTLKAPNTAGITTLTAGAGGITIDQSSHNPVTFTAVGSTPNTNAASLSSQAITLQPADVSNPGVITALAQTIGGNKTFAGTIAASNLSGINTGDITVSDTLSIHLGLVGQSLTANNRYSGTTIVEDVSGIKVGTTLTNANIDAAAAIAYSKLALTGSIVNADVASGAAIAVSKLAALSASKAVISDASGYLTTSTTSSTELSYVTGVTSAIQTQLDSKVNTVTGDITPSSFSAANNQVVAADVTGLAFNNAIVSSAKILLSIKVLATSNLYESFELLAIQRGADWQMSAISVGDTSGFTFSITPLGQVQYLNNNYPGFSAATLKFRAHIV